MRPVYLHGRGLVSVLGENLEHAMTALASGGGRQQRIELPGGTDWPYYSIDHPGQDWHQRAANLIRSAVQEAGITDEQAANGAIPLFIGSSSLDIGAIESGAAQLGDSYHFAEQVDAWLGWSGETYILSSACTSSMQALQAAARLIETGMAEEAVVLGIELFNRFSLSGFAAMQLLTAGIPKPLGRERDGIALGEAVAALHLSATPARWRIRGGSNIVDGRDPTGAVPETVASMCRQALASSGIGTANIDLVKLQAAGSPGNDANELEGMETVFEQMPPLVTLKSTIGHTLGASGAAEIALLLACIEQGMWPRTGYELDPELRYQLATEKPPTVRYILADILGFGGGHAAVVLEDTSIC